MANELTLIASMSFLKGDYTESFVPLGSFSLTVAGTRYIKNVQNVGITIEALSLGESMTTPGYMFAVNRGPTNFVSIYAVITDSVPFAKLKVGECCLVRLGCTAPAVKADTAAINLEYFIVED